MGRRQMHMKGDATIPFKSISQYSLVEDLVVSYEGYKNFQIMQSHELH